MSTDSTWKEENGAIHNLRIEYDFDGNEKSRVATVTTTEWGL